MGAAEAASFIKGMIGVLMEGMFIVGMAGTIPSLAALATA
jgi:hypothetical protein